MRIVILAGGLGTRISEETQNKPKPMVLINGVPIIHHLINIFVHQGYQDFVIATGYKHEVIENWVHLKKDVRQGLHNGVLGKNIKQELVI